MVDLCYSFSTYSKREMGIVSLLAMLDGVPDGDGEIVILEERFIPGYSVHLR